MRGAGFKHPCYPYNEKLASPVGVFSSLSECLVTLSSEQVYINENNYSQRISVKEEFCESSDEKVHLFVGCFFVSVKLFRFRYVLNWSSFGFNICT